MGMKENLTKKIENKEIVVGVVGLGYVGLPLAVEKAKAGFKTIGFDVIYFVLSTNEEELLGNENVKGIVGLDIFNEIRYNSEKFLMGKLQLWN